MTKSQTRTSISVIIILIVLVAAYIYARTQKNISLVSSVPIPSEFKTYKNEKYSFEFRYPENSLIYSSIDSKGNLIPPTDKAVCVSEGKTLPLIERFESDDDYLQFFCVLVYLNKTIDTLLNEEHEQVNFTRADANVATIKISGASDAVYDPFYSQVLMQKGPNVVAFRGSYFYADDLNIGEKIPETFSERAFATFILR